MNLYNPFEVQDRNGSMTLGVCLSLVIIFGLFFGLIIYPAITATILAVLVVSRVVYAIIKGD